ncbi:hypothetical protein ALC57_12875 [Trachymyrmex cornetzi]|uniref:Transposable element P transposase n=1 Tax=Trachymyrmex cornetzi TaxID=471704 RepID=A0A151J0D4_9HYME|nr:hypothetical protein ALC57_12875 [Trachymyrmex cornetzi]
MGKHAYNCLRLIFPQLPSIQTLQSALHSIPISPGLNPFILKHLDSVAKKTSIKESVCILAMKRNVEKKPELGNQEIVHLYDPPHLLKGIRNNLLNKDLVLDTMETNIKTASWDVITKVVQYNPLTNVVRKIT